jgi:hypothetical protein
MVRVRKKRDKAYRLLGDIDEQGSSLLTTLRSYLDQFQAVTEDGSKVVTALSVSTQNDDLVAMLQHGQNGVAADIVGPDGGLRHHQVPEESQLLRCGCLFRLPPADRLGWLAVHVNNGRGVKGLLEKGLLAEFRRQFDDLILEITPFVLGSVFQEAVDQGEIDKIKLIRHEMPDDRFAVATNKWLPAGEAGRIELDIAATGRAVRLVAQLIQRFTRGEPEALRTIVEFEGLRFDEAKIEIVLPDGARRTFNIEHPDAGHPFAEELANLETENGEPTEAALAAALRQVLADVIE